MKRGRMYRTTAENGMGKTNLCISFSSFHTQTHILYEAMAHEKSWVKNRIKTIGTKGNENIQNKHQRQIKARTII